jgi:drug/metabolite transporter (DMT)-like permease
VLVGLAWISQLGGQGLIAYALAHVSTPVSSISLLVQPVCAALLAWVLFGEALGPWQLTGGIIVLTGIYLVRRASRGTLNK